MATIGFLTKINATNGKELFARYLFVEAYKHFLADSFIEIPNFLDATVGNQFSLVYDDDSFTDGLNFM
jgi:hypothetical protein